MSEYIDEREIRRQIEQRHQKRFELIVHALIFAVVNAAFWLVFGGGLWLVWMTLGWSIGLAGHFLFILWDFFNFAVVCQSHVHIVFRLLISRAPRQFLLYFTLDGITS